MGFHSDLSQLLKVKIETPEAKDSAWAASCSWSWLLVTTFGNHIFGLSILSLSALEGQSLIDTEWRADNYAVRTSRWNLLKLLSKRLKVQLLILTKVPHITLLRCEDISPDKGTQ